MIPAELCVDITVETLHIVTLIEKTGHVKVEEESFLIFFRRYTRLGRDT
jgi:hypothetical protein